MVERVERCDNEGHADCPICRGEMSDEFVERMQTAAAQPGRSMTAEEFIAWLDGLGTGPSHLG